MNKASSKKKGTQPEQIQRHLGGIINDFIIANIKLIGIVALIIVVVIASSIGWNAYKKGMNEKALILENEALELYNTVSSETPTEESDPPDSETPAESYQDVLNKYLEIIEKFPGTESAARALYLSGSLEYNLGKYDEAQKHFERYVKKYPKGKLRFNAEKDIGYIFEQQGEYQKSIDQLKRIETKVSSSEKSQLLLAIGRNYESLGQVDKAIETYQSIIDSNTSVTWKNQAREKLDILQPGGSEEDRSEEESTQGDEPPANNTEEESPE